MNTFGSDEMSWRRIDLREICGLTPVVDGGSTHISHEELAGWEVEQKITAKSQKVQYSEGKLYFLIKIGVPKNHSKSSIFRRKTLLFETFGSDEMSWWRPAVAGGGLI